MMLLIDNDDSIFVFKTEYISLKIMESRFLSKNIKNNPINKMENKSIILSKTIVPNDLSIGTSSYFDKIAHLLTSPNLGNIIFAKNIIVTEKKVINPKKINKYNHLYFAILNAFITWCFCVSFRFLCDQ